MDAAAFLLELKRHAPAGQSISDPLAHAQRFIDAHGNTGEGKTLLAVVRALWVGQGEFAESDRWSLSNESLALVAALADASARGLYPDWRWHRASSYPWYRFLLDLHKKYGIE